MTYHSVFTCSKMVLFKRRNILKVVIFIQTLLILMILSWYSRKLEDSDLIKHRQTGYGLEPINNRSSHDRDIGHNKTRTCQPNLTMPKSTSLGNHISETLDQYMDKRLESIREKCSGYLRDPYWQILHQHGKVWTQAKEHIHYCIVPKVGCTFWKRIMRFVSNDFPDDWDVRRPSDIDRSFVHYGKIKNIHQWNVHNPIVQMLMTNGKAFMFARDPFSRLWSAYVDKFFLPDFWRTEAHVIVKRVKQNPPDYELKCANKVSFYEFLLFINMTHNVGLNEHWDKIHRLCSPCHVQYDVIGRQETFGLDVDYILSKYNLGHLKQNTTKLDLIREEIITITKYNFNLEPKIRKGCFDKMDVARRLWLTFQYNGYIHRNAPLPESDLEIPDFDNNPTEIFLVLIFKTLEKQRRKGIDTTGQKRAMMLEEYKKIPERLIADIVTVYEYDFEIFGYKRNLFSLA